MIDGPQHITIADFSRLYAGGNKPPYVLAPVDSFKLDEDEEPPQRVTIDEFGSAPLYVHRPKEYTADPTPGDFDHRGGDCETHGVNVPHFRARGIVGPYYCVTCALAALQRGPE